MGRVIQRRKDETMTRQTRWRFTAATALTAAVAAGSAGATLYATTLDDHSPSTTQASTSSATAVAETSSQLTAAQIYAQSSESVVEVEVTTAVTSPFGDSQSAQAEGTGFVYDEQGHIVTNQHVVDGATSIRVRFSDGSTYDATVVGADASTDVAVLKIDAPASKLHPLELADSSDVTVGEGVVAIGNPFGLENSVTTGIVSAVGREITSPAGTPIEDAIQTDVRSTTATRAAGGPLLNMQGEVIGITSQIESNSGGSEGVGFAVPSNTVATVVARVLGNAAT
jgi:putative serine protease PepD